MKDRVAALVVTFTAALLMTGCATLDYMPYEGAQQEWATKPGSFVRRVDGITIYHGLPPAPYNVLGRIVTVDGNDHMLARCAQSNHADAVVIIGSKVMDGGSVYFPGSTTTSFNAYGATSYSTPGYNVPVTHLAQSAWLIKFTTPGSSKR